ncbi:MAG: hypothetical protein HC925_03050, partial [Coleofasciculaceae cyanobacterium SM2_3_26]|nr:hypothetical protein [Coleofasciculaceae cyanobacterium SM2_3_26]
MGEPPDRLQEEARGDRPTESLTEALPVSRDGSEMPAEPPALTQSATLSEASATSPPVTSPPATSP